MDRTTTTLPTAGCEGRELDLRSTAARRLCRTVSLARASPRPSRRADERFGSARSQVLADGGYGFGLPSSSTTSEPLAPHRSGWSPGDLTSGLWKQGGSGGPQQSAAAEPQLSLPERWGRQTGVDRSERCRLTSGRSPVRARHRPWPQPASRRVCLAAGAFAGVGPSHRREIASSLGPERRTALDRRSSAVGPRPRICPRAAYR